MGPRVIDDLVVGMAGSGGDGIVSAGESLISACAAMGYHAMMTKSFGSQIRGGESSCRVRLATGPVLNPGGALDVAVVLDWDDFLKFGAELPLAGDTVVLYEAGTNGAPNALPFTGVAPAEVVPVPIADIARRATGSDKSKSSVVLGPEGEAHREDATAHAPESEVAILGPTVSRIFGEDESRIIEHPCCKLEGDTVLGDVVTGLPLVPLELHRVR
jgi:hypothetical protein